MNIEQKIEQEKVKRLFMWYSGKKPGPIKIDIEPHRRCNLFCLSCSRRVDADFRNINKKTQELEMSVEKWLSIVNQAAELGVMQWHIAGGGDPPMLPNVTFPIMQEIKKRNMFGILTTNGTNISDRNIQKIVDMSWDRIHFSIDGPDAKTHDYLRGKKGCFEEAISSIKKLKKYRDSKKINKPHLNMNTVLSTKNYDKLDKMVELAYKLGIEYMFVEPLIIYSKWGEKLKLKEEHLKEFPKYLKKDIEWVYTQNKDIKITITKRGFIIYDNYQNQKFNTLLLTVHSGHWIPKKIEKKLLLNEKQRKEEEDIGIERLYGDLVLKKGGIWIDNKLSRFAIDFNRPIEKAIYFKGSESWVKKDIWKKELNKWNINYLHKSYEHFYEALGHIVDTYKFNIIFDGHSMKDGPDRSEISFGTKHIPKFYMPIVRSMQRKLKKIGYKTCLNQPYKGGYIIEWINEKFPDIFLFSIEINKKLYMTKNRQKIKEKNLDKVAKDMTKIFDIEDEY